MPVKKFRRFKRFDSTKLPAANIIGTFEAEDGEWIIWLRKTIGEWHSFSLEAPDDWKPKSVYHSAWNGKRLARTRDMEILRTHNPNVLKLLEETCSDLWYQWDEP